ncbi:anaphase-promoting complex subunit 4-like [Lingula anatina]|uniref:Anaphase-promoting complex subunit 4 n=1 Tax=Lingula anatina TaxID=7574 RepID=A0A1S3IY64_LINAN|nr:anaphase-promoting complex subunit 4-like [Lingula anatina]XP_013403135.1 anaphase-promoting complex subunit 4-like [Lingula anatina]|eukprot:XP_013403134.1 anaphase-promoting complex subunit 4-like [Lingula anatina]
MSSQCSFRQTDEKHVTTEVELMEWSPKMDLLAVANIQGEVLLHRLSWQRVWSLPPPTENSKVKAIAWRTDGKVLAVGYISGEVLLCNVENAAILHTLHVQGEVCSMQWMCDSMAPAAGKKCYKDRSAEYLPKIPTLSKSYGSLSKGHSEENVEDMKKLADQIGLNILLIGNNDSIVKLFAYGIFPVGAVNLKQHKNTKAGRIISLSLSEDLHLLSLIVQSPKMEDQQDQDVYLLSFESTLLASRYEEVQALAFKYGHVVTLLEHLRVIIKQMSEAWEDILLEMDSKLVKFAEEKYMLGTGTVSNDFLELLLFGTPSDELQSFLLHDLTEKGLKKLGHSIETSYSNIQKLVLKHLQSVTQALIYHLNEIAGMASWYDRFGLLGLSSPSVQEAVQMAGAFMLKAVELQQVIDGSMKNFKAFFRWLYVVIQRLSQEAIPAELSKMTQQDLNFVTDFLKEYFTEEMDGSCKSGFKLEKVGQYLKHEELQEPLPNTDNPWLKFVNSSQLLQESPVLFKPQVRQSLVQVEDNLRTAINVALTKPSSAIGQSLQCSGSSYLFTYQNMEEKEEKNKLLKPKFTHFTVCNQQAYQYVVFTASCSPSDYLYLVRQKTHAGSDGADISVVKLKFGCLGTTNREESGRDDRYCIPSYHICFVMLYTLC